MIKFLEYCSKEYKMESHIILKTIAFELVCAILRSFWSPVHVRRLNTLSRMKVSPRRWLENAVALRGPRHESEIVIRQL